MLDDIWENNIGYAFIRHLMVKVNIFVEIVIDSKEGHGSNWIVTSIICYILQYQCYKVIAYFGIIWKWSANEIKLLFCFPVYVCVCMYERDLYMCEHVTLCSTSFKKVFCFYLCKTS